MSDFPFWLLTWQSIHQFLHIALDSLLALPLMATLCLLLGHKRHTQELSALAFLCCQLIFLLFLPGIIDVLAKTWLELRFIPTLSNLSPIEFAPLSPVWLQGTITLLLLVTSCFLIFVATCLRKTPIASSLLTAFAFFCSFASIISRNWPFLGLPPQMTQQRALEVLVSYAWQSSCAALMPAGAILVLYLFFSLEKTTDPKELLPDNEKIKMRMSTAFAIAGAVFQFLDASLLAFNSASLQGIGIASRLAQFGPFFVTALSLTCWIFLFTRPRRGSLFFALFPVLLLILRSLFRF